MKNFLITGHGRSGTNYMAHLFQWFGYDVGNQKIQSDGQAHNFPRDVWPFTKARKHYKYLIQVVRNPQDVIESAYKANYSLPKQNAKDGTSPGRIPEIWKGSDLEMVIRSVVLWNEAIEKAEPDLIVKVEEAVGVCRRWLTDHGFDIKNNTNDPPATNINARTKNGWDLDKPVPYNEVSKGVVKMFKKHCLKYGYPEKWGPK